MFFKKRLKTNYQHNKKKGKQGYEEKFFLKTLPITKKTYREISSEDVDNDDKYTDKDANGTDMFSVCADFEKNGEVWLRYNPYGNWAHKACTDIEKKLYICDYCVQKTFIYL